MDTEKHNDQNSVSVKIGELIKEDSLIIRLKIFENAELDVPALEELFSKSIELMGGQPYCLLTDARTIIYATKEAREFAAENIRANKVIANAILTNSLPITLLANFYIRMNRPDVPTHLFTDEMKANAWLKSIIDGSEIP